MQSGEKERQRDVRPYALIAVSVLRCPACGENIFRAFVCRSVDFYAFNDFDQSVGFERLGDVRFKARFFRFDPVFIAGVGA